VATILLACLVAVAGTPTATDRQVVLAVATEDAEQLRQLEAAVNEAAAAARAQVVATRVAKITIADALAAAPPDSQPPEQTTPLARLWIDATSGSLITLYLTDGARQRLYVRQIPLEDGTLDRVALESITFIVGSSLDALIAGREIGVSRDAFAQDVAAAPPPSPPVAIPAAPPPPEPRRAILSIGYELVRAAPVPLQHRVVIAYQWYGRRVRAGGAAFVAAPQTIAGDPAGAQLLTGGLIVSAGAHWLVARALHLTAGAGAGIEAVRVEPTVRSSSLRATPPFWSGGLSLRGFAGVERAFGRRWLAGLTIGVEAHPSPERYVIGSGQETEVAVEASRWRPFAGMFVGGRI